MSKKKPDAMPDIPSDGVVQSDAIDATSDAPLAKTVELVRMSRDGKAADVHPDEVANYTAYGWQKV